LSDKSKEATTVNHNNTDWLARGVKTHGGRFKKLTGIPKNLLNGKIVRKKMLIRLLILKAYTDIVSSWH